MRPSVSALRPHRFELTSLMLACAMLFSACAPVPPAPEPPPPVVEPPPKVIVVPAPAPPLQPDPVDVASRRLLAYHEQLRQMAPPDVAQEVARMNNTLSVNGAATSPAVILELALALAQQHNGGDLGRAVALVDPIARSSAPESQPWQALARLLVARFSEQRRLEEQLDRQAVQLRDSQRNVQQLNEKLEALKAIERSLNTRPAPPPAPAPGSAPKAP
jgi:hypothetical protein